ncbi:MAG TPA: nucleoside 2-deoxyribosyltransferase [Caulobacteraceae bacterium]|jgi:nucleoside 2-deoxyribosyltransferase|nr:nucleoside 2-deoxyribosyltransferase [Caulobacteraceae bacterium]
MRQIETLFLSGPDLWFPDAPEWMARRRQACEAAGFRAVSGRDNPLVETESSEAMAREIYAAVLERLRGADAVIANLTPWRGPGADSSVAFEAGFAAALGKPVFAYINVGSEDEAEYRARVERALGGTPGEDGRWRDDEGCEIEDFALPETLMLWAEARRFFVIVTPDLYGDLTGLELCLDAVRIYAD